MRVPPPRTVWREIQRPRPSEEPRRQRGRTAIDIPNSAPTGITLLIVEDEIMPAIALKDELEDAGYHVLDLTG